MLSADPWRPDRPPGQAGCSAGREGRLVPRGSVQGVGGECGWRAPGKLECCEPAAAQCARFPERSFAGGQEGALTVPEPLSPSGQKVY
jgi:hypothetical protein